MTKTQCNCSTCVAVRRRLIPAIKEVANTFEFPPVPVNTASVMYACVLQAMTPYFAAVTNDDEYFRMAEAMQICLLDCLGKTFEDDGRQRKRRAAMN